MQVGREIALVVLVAARRVDVGWLMGMGGHFADGQLVRLLATCL